MLCTAAMYHVNAIIIQSTPGLSKSGPLYLRNDHSLGTWEGWYFKSYKGQA